MLRKGRLLVVCLLLMVCLPLRVEASSAASLELWLPVTLVELARTGPETAPALLAAARSLQQAESVYAAERERLQGTRLSIETPLRIDDDGVGGGVQLRIEQPLHGGATRASLGIATGYEWEGSPRLVPAIGLSVDLPLQSTSDVPLLAASHAWRGALLRYKEQARAWQRTLVELYRDVELALIDKNVAELRLQVARLDLEAALVREREGGASAAVLQAARHAVAQAEAAVKTAGLQLDRALAILQEHTGKWDLTEIGGEERKVELGIHIPETADVSDWIALAVDSREDLAHLESAVELAQRQLEQVRRRSGLSGQLQGSVVFPESASRPDSVEWYVGALFTYPLHDGSVREEIRQAELRLEQAMADKEALERQIARDIELASRQLAVIEAVYLQSIESVEYAREILDLAEEALRSGIGTQIAVLEAQIAATEAEKRMMAAYYDLVLQRVVLWHMAGRDVAW